MGEMEQLRKEADNIKDQITVSRPIYTFCNKYYSYNVTLLFGVFL